MILDPPHEGVGVRVCMLGGEICSESASHRTQASWNGRCIFAFWFSPAGSAKEIHMRRCRVYTNVRKGLRKRSAHSRNTWKKLRRRMANGWVSPPPRPPRPPLNEFMSLAFGFPRSNTITRLCVKVSQSLQRLSVGGMFGFNGSLLAWSYGFLPGTYRFSTSTSLLIVFSKSELGNRKATRLDRLVLWFFWRSGFIIWVILRKKGQEGHGF